MVWRGHAFMHSPHDVHFSWSMWARKDAITGASFGQTLRHFVHPIQATPHSFMAIGPRSRLAHATQTIGRSADNGVSSQRLRGQASTHFPHPVHLSRSTWAAVLLRLAAWLRRDRLSRSHHIRGIRRCNRSPPGRVRPRLHRNAHRRNGFSGRGSRKMRCI